MSLDELLNIARSMVRPPPTLRKRVDEVYAQIRSRLSSRLREVCRDFEITLQGSVAKDTFLPSDVDLDIFVLFPRNISKEWFESTFVKIVVDEFKDYSPKLMYAEHPYVRLSIDSFEVDIVPAYRLEPGERPKTAVDRTPLHTKYVLEKLSPEQRDDVRLLKKFMKYIGVYGAEIKVQGFSGYLCELLIITYGSFINTLREATKWRPYRVCIDIEGYYASTKECLDTFKSPLVVVDPVDPLRNAASAVSLTSMARFIAAAHTFLRNPNLTPFVESAKLSYDYAKEQLKELFGKLSKLGIVIVFLRVPELPPDILWGELKRVSRRLRDEVSRYGFEVVDVSVWCNERNLAALALMTLPNELPELELHVGPPVWNYDHVLRFLDKNYESLVLGPWIADDGRVAILRRRAIQKPHEVIERRSNYIFIAPHISPKDIVEICTEWMCVEKYTTKNGDLALWLVDYLKRVERALKL